METNSKFLSGGVCDAARVPVGPKLQWDKESLAYACLSGQVHMRLKSAAHYSGIMEHLLRTQYQVQLTVDYFGGSDQQADVTVNHMRLSQREQKQAEQLIHDSVKYPAAATVDMLQTEAEVTALKLQTISFRKVGAEPAVRKKLYVWRMVHDLYQVSDIGLCDKEFFESYVSSFVESESGKKMQRYYALQRLHHAVYQESSEVFTNIAQSRRAWGQSVSQPLHGLTPQHTATISRPSQWAGCWICWTAIGGSRCFAKKFS